MSCLTPAVAPHEAIAEAGRESIQHVEQTGLGIGKHFRAGVLQRLDDGLGYVSGGLPRSDAWEGSAEVPPDRLEELGVGRHRAHDRDAHAGPAELAPERLRKSDLGELRGRVGSHARNATVSDDRGHDDNVAVVRLLQVRDGRARRVVRAHEVDVHQPHHDGRLGFLERAVKSDTRVADDGVQVSERVDGRLNERLNIALARDIRLEGQGPRTASLDNTVDLCEAIPAARAQGQ